MTDVGEAPVLTPLELAQIGYSEAYSASFLQDTAVFAIMKALEKAEASNDPKAVEEHMGALVVAQGVQIEAHITTARLQAELLQLQQEAKSRIQEDSTSLRLVSPNANETKVTPQAPATPSHNLNPRAESSKPPAPPAKRSSAASPKRRGLTAAEEAARLRRETLRYDFSDDTPIGPSRRVAERRPVGFRGDLYEYLMGHVEISSLGSLNRKELQATWDVVKARDDKPQDFEQRFAALFKRSS